MQIAVLASKEIKDEILQKPASSNVSLQFAHDLSEVGLSVDAMFYLLEEWTLEDVLPKLKKYSCPVIINAVIETLHVMPINFIRTNAWPGFISRSTIEVATNETFKHQTQNLFTLVGWNVKMVADVPGFIAARIIAMVINEAYFALEDNVSGKAEIDIAMKLGTNYPYGPFEWGKKIGLNNVASLLTALAVADPRYTPSALLLTESFL